MWWARASDPAAGGDTRRRAGSRIGGWGMRNDSDAVRGVVGKAPDRARGGLGDAYFPARRSESGITRQAGAGQCWSRPRHRGGGITGNGGDASGRRRAGPDRHVALAGRAVVAELAGGVAAPAVGISGGIDRAGPEPAGADLGERLAGQRAAGIHGDRDAGAGVSAVAQLAEEINTPAVSGASCIHRAGEGSGHGGGDASERLAGQHAAGIHRHRNIGVPDGSAIAKLAVLVVAPAVGSTRAVQRARVAVAAEPPASS